jgi:hypothetical protein
MREAGSGKFRLLLFLAHDSAMLVPAIQSIVGAFHEDLTPFNETGSGKARDRTNDNFLDKGRLHPVVKSTRSAIDLGQLEGTRRWSCPKFWAVRAGLALQRGALQATRSPIGGYA